MKERTVKIHILFSVITAATFINCLLVSSSNLKPKPEQERSLPKCKDSPGDGKSRTRQERKKHNRKSKPRTHTPKTQEQRKKIKTSGENKSEQQRCRLRFTEARVGLCFNEAGLADGRRGQQPRERTECQAKGACRETQLAPVSPQPPRH